MNGAKLKQFAISLLAVLSLIASSAAACACSHHQEKAKTELPSCHEHSSETKAEKTGGDKSEAIETTISEAGCVCLQIAPKVVAKSENIKIKKHLAAISFVNPAEIVFVPQIVAAESDFSKPLYLTDSFYNLSPGRAPPVL